MHCAHESSRCAPGLSRIIVVGACRERSRIGCLDPVSAQSRGILKCCKVVGRMVKHTRRTRGCSVVACSGIPHKNDALSSRTLQGAGVGAGRPRPALRVRLRREIIIHVYALKGRRAHTRTHQMTRRGARAGTREAVRVDVRGATVEATGRDGRPHTTGARRPASCPSVENVRYENVLATKPDLHEVSTVSFVVGTSCGARWPTAIVHEVLFHNMRHKRRRVM